jgi:hypothetical protein
MIEADEADARNRTVVIIPAKDWSAFKAWINRPAEAIPALVELVRRGNFGSEMIEPRGVRSPVRDVEL